MSRALEWLKTGSLVVTSAVAAAKAAMDYRQYRREQQSLEYTRRLQERAWQQVMNGELAEARIGNMQIRAPKNRKKSDVSVSGDDEPQPG